MYIYIYTYTFLPASDRSTFHCGPSLRQVSWAGCCNLESRPAVAPISGKTRLSKKKTVPSTRLLGENGLKFTLVFLTNQVAKTLAYSNKLPEGNGVRVLFTDFGAKSLVATRWGELPENLQLRERSTTKKQLCERCHPS